MDVRPVDTRDVQWEEDMPVFRLTFWRRQPPASGVPPEHRGYEARELEISGAEVIDVLDWARSETRTGETWTLHVTVRCPESRAGQVRLAGSDPTTTERS